MIFYFAWVDSSETTYSHDHARYDENVFSFSITQQEGQCAQLSLTIKNPKIGLLSAGRKVWAWLSYSETDTTGAAPLFFGRLVGIPDMRGSVTGFAELLTLSFIAKPIDFAHQRRALAESLAVLPFYDPLFIDPNLRIDASAHTGDVDGALEARSARWHCSRGEDGLPLVVSYSDICIGEDGTETFESSTGMPAGVDPTSVTLRIAGTPVTSATIKASVGWTQQMPTGPAIDIGSWVIPTYTGEALVSSWPKPGASLGGGWAAAAGTSAVDLADVADLQNRQYNFTWRNTAKSHRTGDPMSTSINNSDPLVKGPYIAQLLYKDSSPGVIFVNAFSIPNDTPPTFDQWSNLPGPDQNGDAINIPLHADSAYAVAPQSVVQASLAITYEQGRKRTENLNFTMTSDIQSVLTDPGDFDTSVDANPPDETIIELNGADVTVPIDGTAPLTDPAVQNYFATTRGIQSVEYLLLRGRAALLNGARLVELSWSVPFNRAVAFTCRKNAMLVWDKLPGGQASGKITGYSIAADGSTGKLSGTVTIMATVGHGVSETTQYTDIAGDGYTVPDYVSGTYAESVGAQTALIGGERTDALADLAYSPPIVDITNTALPLTRHQVLVSAEVRGSLSAQANAILGGLEFAYSQATTLEGKKNATANASANVNNNMKGLDITVEIVLVNVDALALEDNNPIDVQPLMVPKTIDLEAA